MRMRLPIANVQVVPMDIFFVATTPTKPKGVRVQEIITMKINTHLVLAHEAK